MFKSLALASCALGCGYLLQSHLNWWLLGGQAFFILGALFYFIEAANEA